MALTPEREAELRAEMEEAGVLSPNLPRPKVVVRDDRVKRDADVHVSRADPNAVDGDRVVEVRVDFARQFAAALVSEAQRTLGVDEGWVDGRRVVRGYWTLVDGKPCYVEVEKSSNRVVSEYNPLSPERVP